MGNINSRRNAGVEEVDFSTTNAYRYPPKSGCYFGSHFIMGGERFDTTQPEAYLFGENQDLNFLGNRPIPFPYPAPQAHEPTKTLKSLVNIRKDSVRFVKVLDDLPSEPAPNGEEAEKDESKPPTRYNIDFTFDCDARVAITIYYFATEEITNGHIIYHPRDATMNSETFHYKRGANQVFSQTTHIIDPSKFTEEELQYNPDKDVIPVVIHCVVEDEGESQGHSHMTFCIVEKTADGNYNLKALKQKQMVDGLCYLLQEIYGIENKNTERCKRQEDDIDDNGSECVICMSDIRDTLILPCRHLCLCNMCADSLRYQANNCPICRAPFRALLQIRAMRKKPPNSPATTPNVVVDSEDVPGSISQEGVPPGYEAVSLIEALNGANTPTANPNPLPNSPPDGTQDNSSLPTSPEESPKMNKRKAKRNSSVKSSRSVQDELNSQKSEKASKAAQGDGPTQGRGTPEVLMSEMSPEPNKSGSPKKVVLPKVRYPKDEKVDAELSSVEIVNEKVTETKKTGADVASLKDGAVGGEVTPPRETSTPPPDYTLDDEVQEECSNPASHLRTAIATVPVFEKEETDAEKPENEPLCLSTNILEASLPGTPLSSTEGSSFSSTSSSKGLLAIGKPEPEKTE